MEFLRNKNNSRCQLLDLEGIHSFIHALPPTTSFQYFSCILSPIISKELDGWTDLGRSVLSGTQFSYFDRRRHKAEKCL